MAEKPAPTQAQPVPKKRKKKLPTKKIFFGGIITALIIFGGFYFVQYNTLNAKYKDLTLSADEKNKQTAAEVAKLIDLPKDETPTVYAVKDKDKLADTKAAKEFFEKAQNDDVVLAYQKADLAVIYRPGEKRIIKTDNYQKFLAASSPITVAIIAPGDQQGTLVQQLESKFGNVQIVKKDAPKILNGQSYVVDLSGTNAKTAQDLATQLGLQVGALPEGETKPEGAVLAVVVAPAPPI